MNNSKKKRMPLKLKVQKSSSSPIIKEKISSYFPILSQENALEKINEDEAAPQEILIEKPILKSNKKLLLNTSDDSVFSTKEKPKSTQILFNHDKPKVSKRPLKHKSSSSLESLAKSGSGEFNLEHLQLALAMSNSLQEEDKEEKIESTQQKLESLRETLRQFGFNTGNTSGLPLPKAPSQKRKKKQIFRSILLIRSDTDRKRIIEQKVNEIISNVASYNEYRDKNTPPVETSEDEKPQSFTLREILDVDASIFKKSSLDYESKNYFNTLVNQEDCAKTGALLRDWHKIPGREKTPTPETKISTKEETTKTPEGIRVLPETSSTSPNLKNSLQVPNKSDLLRSESPDLFSDDSVHSPEILHYENYNDDCHFNLSSSSNEDVIAKSPVMNKESQDVIDLTQTSDTLSGSNLKIESTESNKDLSANQSDPEIIKNDSIIQSILTKAISSQKLNRSKEFDLNHEISLDLICDLALSPQTPQKVTTNTNDEPILPKKQDSATENVNVTLSKLILNSSVSDQEGSADRRPNVHLPNDTISMNDSLNEQDQDEDPNLSLLNVSCKTFDQNITTISDSESDSDIEKSFNHKEKLNTNKSRDELGVGDKLMSSLINASGPESEDTKIKLKKYELNSSYDSDNDLMSSQEAADTKRSFYRQRFKELTLDPKKPTEMLQGLDSTHSNSENCNKEISFLNELETLYKKPSLDTGPSSTNDNNSIKNGFTYNPEKSEQKAVEPESNLDGSVFTDNKSEPKKRPSSNIEDDQTENQSVFDLKRLKTVRSALDLSDSYLEKSRNSFNFNRSRTSTDVLNLIEQNQSSLNINAHERGSSPTDQMDQQPSETEEIGFIIPKAARKRSISVISSDSEDDRYANFGLSQAASNYLLNDDELNYSSYLSNTKRYQSMESISPDSSFEMKEQVQEINKSISLNSSVELKEIEPGLNSVLEISKLNQTNRFNESSFRFVNENDDLDHFADQLAQENVYNQDFMSKYQDLTNKTLIHRRISELKSTPVKNDQFHPTPKVNSPETPKLDLNETPDTPICQENILDKTPDNKNTPGPEMIIKTSNVTPMGNYNEMDTPQRNKELDKFGLKPMSKGKSVKILEYLYNATHPVCDSKKGSNSDSSESENRKKPVSKRRKVVKRDNATPCDESSEESNSDGSDSENGNKPVTKRRKVGKKEYVSNRAVRNRKSQQLFIHKDTEEPIALNFDLNNISVDEMIFERVYSKNVLSCALPFHIAWHNFISTQPGLRDAMLLYEPIQLEEIYMYFKNLGYKFHIQDIQTFLDRKCITIRTAQNNR